LEKALAYPIAAAIITSIPGIFGFLVWELKENWRLYEANRQPRLGPVSIGEHGETMPRLLRRGFHSGTLPRRYAKLRRAERRARLKGNWKAVRKRQLALAHVERSIRHYIEREFLELFVQSECWRTTPLRLEEVRLGPSGIQLDLWCPGLRGGNLRLAFDARCDWLVAGVVRPGWAESLPPQEREVLTAALAGLYKSAGVDVVRQQIEAALGEQASRLPEAATLGNPPSAGILPEWNGLYDIDGRGLIVWPDSTLEVEAVYDLRPEGAPEPVIVRGRCGHALPPLDRALAVFGQTPVLWRQWVEIWQKDLPEEGRLPPKFAALRVLAGGGEGA
jgi:hypothetical protein